MAGVAAAIGYAVRDRSRRRADRPRGRDDLRRLRRPLLPAGVAVPARRERRGLRLRKPDRARPVVGVAGLRRRAHACSPSSASAAASAARGSTAAASSASPSSPSRSTCCTAAAARRTGPRRSPRGPTGLHRERSLHHDRHRDRARGGEPGWDPSAADPAGWDLPERAAVAAAAPARPRRLPAAPQRRRSSKVGSVTFALAVLTAGGGVLANLNGATLVLRAAHHRPGARRGRDRPGRRRVRPRRARPDRARRPARDRRDGPDDRAVRELRLPRRRGRPARDPALRDRR